MPTSTAKKIKVFHAEPLAAMSFQVRTRVTSMMAMPTNAAVVASIPMREPKIQRTRSSTNVKIMVISPRVILPMVVSSRRAIAGASGVFLTVGP